MVLGNIDCFGKGGNYMTKAQLKEKYLEWNREITSLQNECDKIFKEFQELNAQYGDGNKWCSIETNMTALIKAGYENTYKLYDMVAKYHNYKGQFDALIKLAKSTQNFNIGR